MIDGDRLRELRKDKRMTQKQLADAVLKGRPDISRYENGKQQPDAVTLCRLGDIFNVSVDYLLGRTKRSRPWEEPPRHVVVDDLSDADVDKVKTYVAFLRSEKAK